VPHCTNKPPHRKETAAQPSVAGGSTIHQTSNAVFTTVVARNYLPQALALYTSLREKHPETDVWIVVTDACPGEVEAAARHRLRILTPDEFIHSGLSRLQFQYELVEFATAIKADLLIKALETYEKAIFLDPDIWVYDRLDPVLNALDRYNAILTPHLLGDFPEDGLQPDISTILLHGIYNLGFFAIKRTSESIRLLQWWRDKLLNHCTLNTDSGYYVDQKVMNVAPLFFEDVLVDRSKRLNVAWWNLHERPLTREGERILAGGGPLTFFHFSDTRRTGEGWQPPWQIRRLDQETQRLFATLAEHYFKAVDTHRTETGPPPPYKFNYFESGKKIHPRTRTLFRSDSVLQEIQNPFRSSRLEELNYRTTLKAQIEKCARRTLSRLWAIVRWLGEGK
jgi:hypothetical protein